MGSYHSVSGSEHILQGQADQGLSPGTSVFSLLMTVANLADQEPFPNATWAGYIDYDLTGSPEDPMRERKEYGESNTVVQGNQDIVMPGMLCPSSSK